MVLKEINVKVSNRIVVENNPLIATGNLNIYKMIFNFPQGYEELTSIARFTTEDELTYKAAIIDNVCYIPFDALKETGKIKFGVYSYKDEELLDSPRIVELIVQEGSYIEESETEKEFTLNDFEKYIEQSDIILKKIEAMDEELTEKVNEIQRKLDEGEFDGFSPIANVEKVENITTISITDKEGTTIAEIKDGVDGIDGIDGIDATINGVTTLQLVVGENMEMQQEGQTLKLNSKKYDDTDIQNQIDELQEETSQLERDIVNTDNKVTTLTQELQEQESNINHLDDIKADKETTYNKQEVNELIGAIKTISMKIVPERPVTGETNIIYLVPSPKSEPENIYDEYIYVNDKWELIGSTQIDLSDYVKNTDYATKDIAGVAKIGSYGTSITSDGSLRASVASLASYNVLNQNGFIAKGTLENIIYDYVKRGLVDNNIILSDEEKLKIETWLGLAENYLTTYNTIPYQVEGEYNPTHKKYVDGQIKTLDDKVKELELFKFPNMTIVGTPTIQNGQVSNFTMNDYLEFPFLVDFRRRPFEINFAFTTGNNVTTQQNILDSAFGLALAIKNGKTLMAISYDGNTWANQYTGSLVIEPNTTYVYKIIWNGIMYRVQYYNGSQYVDDFYFASTQQPYPKQMFVGVSKLSDNYFEGTINLNYANLKVDGNVVWSGMDDAGLASRLATDLSNIDEAGVQYINNLIDNKITNAIGGEY